MNNVKAPYNVNKLTSDAAANALRNTHVLKKNVKEVLEQREIVAEQLRQLDFVVKVYPSDSNFLLFRVKQKANELYKTVSGLYFRPLNIGELFVAGATVFHYYFRTSH